MTPSGMKRVALFGFFAAFALVHGIVASWTPVQGDDWGPWMWAAHHADDSLAHRALAWLGSHHAIGDAFAYAASRSDIFHVIASPAMACALVVGLFVLALRRLPRMTWDDILGLALISALLWLGSARGGLTWFHREFVAAHVYTAAIAAWWLAPLRCGWRAPKPLMIAGAIVVGTCPAQVAIALLVVTWLAYRRGARPDWLKPSLIALAIATVATLALPPWLELPRVLKRGFEPNFILFGIALRPAGVLVAIVLALVIVDRALGGGEPSADAVDPVDSSRWFGASLGLSALALFGPKYSEATLVPATCAVIVGVLPWLLALAQRRGTWILLAATAIGTHLVVWTLAIATYRSLGAEWRDRRDLLEHATSGEVVTLPTYTQVLASYWLFGEDFGGASSRQEIANDVFGARDIELAPTFRRYEANPRLETTLQVDGVSPEVVARVAPRVWATEPAAARHEFENFIERLSHVVGRVPEARLIATGVTFAEAAGRPLLVAWSEHGEVAPLRTARSPLDANDRYQITVYPPFDKQFDEAWLVANGTVARTEYLDGHPRLQPMVADRAVVIVCGRDRCAVADALVPRF